MGRKKSPLSDGYVSISRAVEVYDDFNRVLEMYRKGKVRFTWEDFVLLKLGIEKFRELEGNIPLEMYR